MIDTGVRLERTVTLGNEHAHADVRDRWVSADGAAHAVRVEYSHGAAADALALPGSPVFRHPGAGERVVADKLLVHDGTPAQADRRADARPGAGGAGLRHPGQRVERAR